MLPSGPAAATCTAPSIKTSLPPSLLKRRRMRLPATETRTSWRIVTLEGSASGTTTGTLPGLSIRSGVAGGGAGRVGAAAKGTAITVEAGGDGVTPGGRGVGTKPQAPIQFSFGADSAGAAPARRTAKTQAN